MAGGFGRSKSTHGYNRLLSGNDSSEETGKEKAPIKGKKAGAKAHPLLKLLESKNQKKAMATPEFLRYMEYLKEGGSASPAMDSSVK